MYAVDEAGMSGRLRELFQEYDDSGSEVERYFLLRQITALHDLLNSVTEMCANVPSTERLVNLSTSRGNDSATKSEPLRNADRSKGRS